MRNVLTGADDLSQHDGTDLFWAQFGRTSPTPAAAAAIRAWHASADATDFYGELKRDYGIDPFAPARRPASEEGGAQLIRSVRPGNSSPEFRLAIRRNQTTGDIATIDVYRLPQNHG